MPELRPRPALDQPARRPPLSERDRVVERRPTANDGAGRLDVGAGVEQGIENPDVVAARSSVQRRLSMAAARERRIDVGAGPDESGHRAGPVRMVARPVGGDVQQRAGAVDARRREPGMSAEQVAQFVDATSADRLDRCGGWRVVR
jgi:hypothetical protein